MEVCAASTGRASLAEITKNMEKNQAQDHTDGGKGRNLILSHLGKKGERARERAPKEAARTTSRERGHQTGTPLTFGVWRSVA